MAHSFRMAIPFDMPIAPDMGPTTGTAAPLTMAANYAIPICFRLVYHGGHVVRPRAGSPLHIMIHSTDGEETVMERVLFGFGFTRATHQIMYFTSTLDVRMRITPDLEEVQRYPEIFVHVARVMPIEPCGMVRLADGSLRLGIRGGGS